MAEIGELITTCNGRLTLTSGVPVTTSDVTGATTLYFTPYLGDHIALWNGEVWIFHQFEELSLSLSGYTADTNYDIWMYNNAGVLTLESTAWASATARATALATQNGVYAKTGDTLRRYLGTIRITGTTGQCEDSESKRFCWNYYNRVARNMRIVDISDHTYASSTKRYWNNDSSYKIEYIIGVIEDVVFMNMDVALKISSAGSHALVGFGVDTEIDVNDEERCDVCYTNWIQFGINNTTNLSSIGYHYIAILEWVSSNTGSYDNLLATSIING